MIRLLCTALRTERLKLLRTSEILISSGQASSMIVLKRFVTDLTQMIDSL